MNLCKWIAKQGVGREKKTLPRKDWKYGGVCSPTFWWDMAQKKRIICVRGQIYSAYFISTLVKCILCLIAYTTGKIMSKFFHLNLYWLINSFCSSKHGHFWHSFLFIFSVIHFKWIYCIFNNSLYIYIYMYNVCVYTV